MGKNGLRSSRREEESYTWVCDQCGYRVRIDATFIIHETYDRVAVTCAVVCDYCGNMMWRDEG